MVERASGCVTKIPIAGKFVDWAFRISERKQIAKEKIWREEQIRRRERISLDDKITGFYDETGAIRK